MTEKLSVSELTENYGAVRKRLSEALERAGRRENEVTLLAATKTVDPETINRAIELGITHIGENRVQELLSKNGLIKPVHNHFIGHLQTNKVKYVVPCVSIIHSVDSERLLREIEKSAAEIGRRVSCLLEIHVAQEESKYGFSVDECRAMLSSLDRASLPHICIRGVMGMATYTDDEVAVRSDFARLRSAFDAFRSEFFAGDPNFSILSMGMSGDYTIAIEEGSTMVRVGSSIFGERI